MALQLSPLGGNGKGGSVIIRGERERGSCHKKRGTGKGVVSSERNKSVF